jgi:hypothetical protein
MYSDQHCNNNSIATGFLSATNEYKCQWDKYQNSQKIHLKISGVHFPLPVLSSWLSSASYRKLSFLEDSTCIQHENLEVQWA